MHYMSKKRQIQGILESPSAWMGSMCLVFVGPYLSFHSISPRTDYAKKEHFSDVDNSRTQLSGQKYELQEAWDNGFKTYNAFSKRNFIMRVWYMYSTHACRRMHYSLAGVCMEGSRAPHARELLSFIGFRPVTSFLASTCIDSSWILAISSGKTRRTSSEVELPKTLHHLR